MSCERQVSFDGPIGDRKGPDGSTEFYFKEEHPELERFGSVRIVDGWTGRETQVTVSHLPKWASFTVTNYVTA
jgi:hypothetical protein